MGQEWWGGDGDTRQCPDNRRSDSSPCASWDVGKGRAAFALASSVSCVYTVVWSDSRDRWNGDHECGFYLGVTLPAKHTCVQRQLSTPGVEHGEEARGIRETAGYYHPSVRELMIQPMAYLNSNILWVKPVNRITSAS